MRILMVNRSTHYSSPGGDTVQVESTAEFLRKIRLKVDIAIGPDPVDYSKYDLLHFFNIIRPANILAHIQRCDKPFVVSPIFVDYSEYERFSRMGPVKTIGRLLPNDIIEYLKVIVRKIKNGERIGSVKYLLIGQRRSINHIVKRATVLLPNSESEYVRLSRNYNVNKRYFSIPNAINAQIFDGSVPINKKFKDSVICVARIEGIKNQLNLIKAVSGLEIPLFIIGKPAPNHYSYYKKCRIVAGTNVSFITHISQQELVGIYKAARVHAMPSWFETTGLSTLEAAAMGCNVVITKKGDQEEYFKEFVYYCEPDDIASIRDAVLKAYYSQSNTDLKKYILANYTWEKTAQKTFEAYQAALQKKKVI